MITGKTKNDRQKERRYGPLRPLVPNYIENVAVIFFFPLYIISHTMWSTNMTFRDIVLRIKQIGQYRYTLLQNTMSMFTAT
jgi:hypothetical protein